MYIGHETFLLESRFLVPQFCLPPDKKLLFTRVSLHKKINIEYRIVWKTRNIEIQEKLESNTNLYRIRIRSCRIFLQISLSLIFRTMNIFEQFEFKFSGSFGKFDIEVQKKNELELEFEFFIFEIFVE